jgi:hypothetical protein
MLPQIKASQDALQDFVQAKEAARANPADTALQCRVEEAKEVLDLEEAVLQSLEIEHGFMQPPAPPWLPPPLSATPTTTPRPFIERRSKDAA